MTTIPQDVIRAQEELAARRKSDGATNGHKHDLRHVGAVIGKIVPADKLAHLRPGAAVEQPAPTWQPTAADVQAAIAAKRHWPTFADLNGDHLESPWQRDRLQHAINTVKRYIAARREDPALSLLMISADVDALPDNQRAQLLQKVGGNESALRFCNGYGCGKTTLAKIVHYSNVIALYAQAASPEELADLVTVAPRGIFMTGADIMQRWYDEDFSVARLFSRGENLLVIDDIGREGALKFEKRDQESQAAELQARYFQLVNFCYEHNIGIVITSNLPARLLAAHIGLAAWDRLIEMAPETFRINMTGLPSARQHIAAQKNAALAASFQDFDF